MLTSGLFVSSCPILAPAIYGKRVSQVLASVSLLLESGLDGRPREAVKLNSIHSVLLILRVMFRFQQTPFDLDSMEPVRREIEAKELASCRVTLSL